jgi:hypothetical protein
MCYSNARDTVFVDKWKAGPRYIYVITSFTGGNKKGPRRFGRGLFYTVNNSRYYLAASKRFVTSAQFTTFQNAAI